MEQEISKLDKAYWINILNQNNDIGKRYKGLIEGLFNGRLNQTTFQEACLFWLLEQKNWESLQPVGYPAEPITQAFQDYKSADIEKRRKLEKKFYEDNPEILEYFSALHAAYNFNRGKKEYLTKLLEFCFVAENFEKVKAKISQFAQKEIQTGAILGIKEFLADEVLAVGKMLDNA